jgi:outer membrane protein assembly factor BamD
MRHSLALILLLTLTACGVFSSPDEKKEAKSEPVEKLYADAKEELDNSNYEKAVKSFETLQSRYPYGRYAQQAQLETAYAYFKQKEPESAISAADRFIKKYPNNPHVDYAYYLKGLVNFNEDLGLLSGISKQDLAERDPNSARQAFEAFKELVTRFPDSKYAPNARVRMQYLINILARHEIRVASYYLRRGAYVAAANRAKGVLTDYSQTPATRDALQIMVQAYDALGMIDLRNDAQRVLDLNIAKDGTKAPAVRQSPNNEASWWQFWK